MQRVLLRQMELEAEMKKQAMQKKLMEDELRDCAFAIGSLFGRRDKE